MIMNVTGGGGGSGGTLVVTSSGAGTVTVSNDTIGKSYSRSVVSGGTVIFRGLKTGTWSVTLSDGTYSTTKQIAITADYSISVAYFAATINVTYPAGSSCIAWDGEAYTESSPLAAPDTSGTWACVVPKTGTWTFHVTDGAQTKMDSVEITDDGQTESITLAYFTSYITVAYPAGTTKVTCWNKTTGNAGGEYIITDGLAGICTFTVGEAGTYGVDATANGKYKDSEVVITASGQSKSVTLSYELVLFDNGNYDQETGGWEAATDGYNASYDIAETTPELIVAKSSSSASGFARCYTKSKVDLTEIKTIVFNVKFSQTNDFRGKVGIANTQTPDFTNPSNFVAYKSLSVSTEYIDVSIDVSSLSGSYYVVLGGYKGGYGQINCKKILGERL